MRKFVLSTLGCKVNQYETQVIQEQLEEIGFQEAKDGESVDLCLVNTCAVTAGAEKDSKTAIKQLRSKYPEAEICVTGCFAKKGKEELLQLDPEIILVPHEEKENLVAFLFSAKNLSFHRKKYGGHTRAFIKVQDGCNRFCSYCIIPYIRGRSKSRSIEEIAEEAKVLTDLGCKEIVLTGIHIGDYAFGLDRLIQEMEKINTLDRVRISSLDPASIDEKLFEAITQSKKVAKSLHLSLQSGSEAVLEKMNRKYTAAAFRTIAKRFCAKDPDFTLTTDIIVGFPGETEENFLETVSFVEEIPFLKVHIFPYSKRVGTRAATFVDDVSNPIKKERRDYLQNVSEKRALLIKEKFLHREMEVLIEDSNPSSGYTDNYLRVVFPKRQLEKNQIVKTELVELSKQGYFMGE